VGRLFGPKKLWKKIQVNTKGSIKTPCEKCLTVMSGIPGTNVYLNRIMDLIIMEAVKSGKNVINDDTNLNPVHENRIREMLKDKPWVTVKIQNFMDIPIETCIERDNQRLGSHCIGEKAIREQLKRFERDKKKVEGSISI
jgi:predicted kinase